MVGASASEGRAPYNGENTPAQDCGTQLRGRLLEIQVAQAELTRQVESKAMSECPDQLVSALLKLRNVISEFAEQLVAASTGGDGRDSLAIRLMRHHVGRTARLKLCELDTCLEQCRGHASAASAIRSVSALLMTLHFELSSLATEAMAVHELQRRPSLKNAG